MIGRDWEGLEKGAKAVLVDWSCGRVEGRDEGEADSMMGRSGLDGREVQEEWQVRAH